MNLFTPWTSASPLPGTPLYPHPTAETLKAHFQGKDLREIPGPAAVIDVAVVRRNCACMLEAVHALNVKFRAHVKTHKTVEIARLQAEDAHRGVQLIVSTVAEAEHLLGYLLECKEKGRDVNVLYGIPPSSSSVTRLLALRKLLGPSSISFLIDHPSQLQNLVMDPSNREPATEPIPVFVKVDTGYHRAGVPPATKAFDALLEVIAHAQSVSSQPNIRLHGFYSHNSNSYNGSSPTDALEYLEKELTGVIEAADRAAGLGFAGQRFTLSVGATPSASSAQNLLARESQDATVTRVKELIVGTQASHDVELHAGVYPLLDLQQVATMARPAKGSAEGVPTMGTADIGVRIMGEVLSTYATESRATKPEALVGAGTLALGREPCKSYDGWGVLAPVPWHEGSQQVYGEEEKTGWIVGRTSQEHGILRWEGSQEQVRELKVGERVLIWPNHACIALAGFGWILVVDEAVDGGKKVVDVWVRCRGW